MNNLFNTLKLTDRIILNASNLNNIERLIKNKLQKK